MNIDIIRRNIEQVISQPCKSKYPDEIKPNGISPDGVTEEPSPCETIFSYLCV